MKTIYKKKLWDIVPVVDLDEENDGTGHILDTNGNIIDEVKIFGYDYYEYKKDPLYFVRLNELDSNQKINLISLFDKWYGDTAQNTTDWSLEFQLVTRMLLESSLIINPKHLKLEDECYDKIIETIYTNPEK